MFTISSYSLSCRPVCVSRRHTCMLHEPHCMARHPLQPPQAPAPPRGGGPLAPQRATRSSRAERPAPRARGLPTAQLRGGALPLHRPSSARRGDERGSARGRGPPSRGGSHGPPSAFIMAPLRLRLWLRSGSDSGSAPAPTLAPLRLRLRSGSGSGSAPLRLRLRPSRAAERARRARAARAARAARS